MPGLKCSERKEGAQSFSREGLAESIHKAYRLNRRMPDNFPFDQIDHHFGDVGGMIRDSFDVLRDERDADRPTDGLRVLDHVREEFAKNLPG